MMNPETGLSTEYGTDLLLWLREGHLDELASCYPAQFSRWSDATIDRFIEYFRREMSDGDSLTIAELSLLDEPPGQPCVLSVSLGLREAQLAAILSPDAVETDDKSGDPLLAVQQFESKDGLDGQPRLICVSLFRLN